MRTPFPSLVIALALLAGACGGSGSGAAGAASTATVEVVDFAKLEQVLASHRGHPLVLNLWATWCGPCVEELPELVEVAHAHEKRGVATLLVSYDLQIPKADPTTILPRVARFVEGRKYDLPVLVYDAPDQEAINERLKLPGHIPVTLAFDKDGREVDRCEGEADRARFEQLYGRALGN